MIFLLIVKIYTNFHHMPSPGNSNKRLNHDSRIAGLKGQIKPAKGK